MRVVYYVSVGVNFTFTFFLFLSGIFTLLFFLLARTACVADVHDHGVEVAAQCPEDSQREL